VKSSDIRTANIDDAATSKLRNDMQLEQALIRCNRSGLPPDGYVLAYKILGYLAKSTDCPRLASLIDRIGTSFDSPEQLLGLGPRFIWGEAPVLPDSDTARPAILPELCNIGLPPTWEGRCAEAGEGIVPEKHAILPERADQSVNRAFADPST